MNNIYEEFKEQALNYAFASGKPSEIHDLLRKGHDINSISGLHGHSPLVCATIRNEPRFVRLAIQLGADINAHNGLAINLAYNKAYCEEYLYLTNKHKQMWRMFAYLLKLGAKTNFTLPTYLQGVYFHSNTRLYNDMVKRFELFDQMFPRGNIE